MIKGHVEGDFNHVYEAMFRLDTMEAYTDSLLVAWTNVLIEDNRRGVMMGVDGDGQRMKPTKYRNSFVQTSAGQATDTFFNSQGTRVTGLALAYTGPKPGAFFSNITGTPGARGFKGSSGDNLTTAQYKKMSGPPLAPRGVASRVISNYTVEYIASPNMVGVEGGWNDVVSKKGVPFLPFHFSGATFSRAFFAAAIGGDNHHLPRRNLVGLRQWGKTQARKELNAWIKWLLTVAQPEYFGRRRAGHAPKYVRNKR
jgi:hypothetical protein